MMTPLEINELIAEYKEIKTAIINNEVHSLYDDGSRHEYIDYTTDWNLCGPLMEELGKAETNWIYEYDEFQNKHEWRIRYRPDIYIKHEDLKTSICLAYIEEFIK